MKRVVFFILIFYQFSCTNSGKRIFDLEGVGTIEIYNNNTFRSGLESTGNWYKKGNLYIFKSHENPNKISSIDIVASGGNTSKETVLFAEYKKTGASPTEIQYHFTSSNASDTIVARHPKTYISLSKDMLADYDSVFLAIPWQFSSLRYSISKRYSLGEIQDSMTFVLDAPPTDFYRYFDNKSYLKRGNKLIAPM